MWRRSFASAANINGKMDWLCIIPDYPNVLSKRLSVREKHLEVGKKTYRFGGAYFGEHPASGVGPENWDFKVGAFGD